MQKLNKLINKLPSEIINIILSYTYNLQNNVLLEDIRNYINTKKQIITLYYHTWIIFFEEAEPEDKYWLINNIICYCKKWKKYIIRIDGKDINTQINLLWGILLPNERCEMIDSYRVISDQITIEGKIV
jgi:hypothetical protein